jgi:outer membrane protein OmpA-like peptidoglycan-associated protein
MKYLQLFIFSFFSVTCFAQGVINQAKYTLERRTDAFVDANMAFSPDGNYIAYPTMEGEVKIFDLVTGKELKVLKASEKMVVCVAYSPDGKYLACGNKDGFFKIWSTSDYIEKWNIEAHNRPVLSIQFSPDNQWLLTGSRDNRVRIWDIVTGKEVKETEKANANIKSIAFTPDGKQIIVSTSAILKSIQYFDVHTGKETKELPISNTEGISISPDESLLATANLKNNVFLWDAITGNKLDDFIGHANYIKSVSFSPGGKLLVSCSQDKKVKLWEVKSRTLLYTFSGHTENVQRVAYSPKGDWIASSSWDKTIRIWSLKGLSLPDDDIYNPNGVVLPVEDQEVLNTTFKNLEFEFGKSEIKSSSFSSLDNLANMLNKKKTYKICIAGHTDNVGDATFNYKLSIQRAEAVKTYLISKKVNEKQINVQGFGATKPVASNENEEGRAKNRRVEFIVIEK